MLPLLDKQLRNIPRLVSDYCRIGSSEIAPTKGKYTAGQAGQGPRKRALSRPQPAAPLPSHPSGVGRPARPEVRREQLPAAFGGEADVHPGAFLDQLVKLDVRRSQRPDDL